MTDNDLRSCWLCVPCRKHASSVAVHASSVTVHASSVTVHASSVTVHASSVTVHASPVTVHASPVTVHVSPVTVHVSNACFACFSLPGRTHGVRLLPIAVPSHSFIRSRFARDWEQRVGGLFGPRRRPDAVVRRPLDDESEGPSFAIEGWHRGCFDEACAAGRSAQVRRMLSRNATAGLYSVAGTRRSFSPNQTRCSEEQAGLSAPAYSHPFESTLPTQREHSDLFQERDS
jgi:hypothetical protein